MMRSLLLKSTVLATVLAGLGVAAGLAERPATFDLRVVQLPGSLSRDNLEAHLDYLHELGFNSLWVQTHQISDNPFDPAPVLNEASRVLAAWCARKNVRLIVSLNPAIVGADRYAISDAELVVAIRRFAKRIRRDAGVTDLVLSFETAAPELTELRDVLAYGRDVGPAHADLAARVRRRLPKKIRLWFHPARPYTTPSLQAVAALPLSIGLVWHGPAAVSPQVKAADADRLAAIVGSRAILLRDRFPANQAGNRMPLSNNLGPLRGRDPELVSRIAGHVSVAMEDWGASRLTLITVADWLRSPRTYEAKPSWERAMRTLAGDDAEALKALRTQALEWGGPLGGRNHHTALTDNPAETSRVFRDPALVSRWRWTLTRYPERMRGLQGLADRVFRDELLEMMARRLAIARAIPPVREILTRQSAGRSDLGGLIAEVNHLRDRVTRPTVRIALERFLHAAGVLGLLGSAESPPAKRN